jgi:Xaa-Pro dipeptidase
VNLSLPVQKAAYRERQQALIRWAAENGLTGVLVTSPHAIFYYCGFATTGYYLPHVLIVVGQGACLIVRDFEDANGALEAEMAVWSTAEPFETVLGNSVRRMLANGKCAYEDFSNFFRPQLLTFLAGNFPDIAWVPSGRRIDALRKVKSEAELAMSRRSGQIALAGLSSGLASLHVGASEHDISVRMLNAMMMEGGEVPPSFPYTYFGTRSHRRMQQPTATNLQNDELFYLECGASYGRYGAALLRTGIAGKANRELYNLYDAALRCLELLEDSIRPGARSCDLDLAARSELAKHGVADLCLSKFGYSIGIGFAPGWGEANVFDIDPNRTDSVEEGLVLHLVVTLMGANWGSVGLSETIEVTAKGCVRLTPYSRALIELN